MAVLESSGSIQEVFAALADEVDGFAGLYYDQEGRLTVTMTDTDRIEDVREPVSSVLRAGLRGQESLPGYAAAREQIDQDVSELRAELAQFDYRQLYDWYHGQIVNGVGGLASVTSMHIDEPLNRVVVGVEHSADIPDVEHRLEALSVPELALEVRQFDRVEIFPVSGTLEAEGCDPDTAIEPCPDPPPGGATYHLHDTRRPAVGGLRIEYWLGHNLRPCTMGFHLHRALPDGSIHPDRYFLVNSHCTNAFGGGSGTMIGQSSAAETVGTEIEDPAFSASLPGCPPGRVCRYSDAALVEVLDSAHGLPGYIAYPSSLGSKVVNSPRLVEAVALLPLVGTPVEKVGQTTGRTAGTLSHSCLTLNPEEDPFDPLGRTFLCQVAADDLESLGGDSGAPVFQVAADGSLIAQGMIWGNIGGGQGAVLSDIHRIMDELSIGGTYELDPTIP